MSNEQGDWVREGTPQDSDADWNEVASEYGTAVSPVEWDDYSSEQAVPVTPPQPRSPVSPVRAAEEPADELVDEPDVEAAPVQEGDALGSDGYVTAAADVQDDEAAVPDYAEAADAAATPEPAAEEFSDAPEAREDPAVEDAPVLVDEDEIDEEPVHLEEPVGLPATDYVEDPVDEPVDQPVDAFDESRSETADVVVPGVRVEDESASDAEFAVPAAGDGESVLDEPTSDAAVSDDAPAADYDPDATRVSPAVFDDASDEPTAAVPLAAAGVSASAGAAPYVPEDVYRTGETQVIRDQPPAWDDAAEAEERRLAEQLEAERRARDERLGVVPPSAEQVPPPAAPAKVTTDRFFASFGLMGLRLVTAFIVGLAGYNVLTQIDDTVDVLSRTLIPEPRLVAWILGFTLGGIALFLVIGLLQRVVGFLLLALSVGSLVFLHWGAFNPFENQDLIAGDRALLLAAIGLVLLGLGGGLWGIDGAFRRSRAKAKAEKQH